MASHSYRVGEMVFLNAHAGFSVKSDIVFTVRAHLPPRGDALQYRIKSESEPYERVVMESQLTRVTSRDGSADGVFAPTR